MGYACNYFTGPYNLNEQAHKRAIQYCSPPVQEKFTHGDIDLICVLIRGQLSPFTSYLKNTGAISSNFLWCSHDSWVYISVLWG